MIDRIIEIGTCYEMKMNVGKTGNENVKGTFRIAHYDRSKTAGECGIFQLFWLHDTITNKARCTREVKSRIAIATSEFNRKDNFFTRKST